MACLSFYLFDKSTSYLDLFFIFVGFIASVFSLTFGIKIDAVGIEIKSSVAPFINDNAIWTDVKRVKVGILFKEVEYYSRKKNKLVVFPLSGIAGNLDELIMKKINQSINE